MQQEYSGIMGGSDSFTIIGPSGLGKSTAISRAIHLITEGRIVEVENPYTKIIPCVCVQCPFDSSVKGLLLEVLRKVDEAIDSNYYQNALPCFPTMGGSSRWNGDREHFMPWHPCREIITTYCQFLGEKALLTGVCDIAPCVPSRTGESKGKLTGIVLTR